MRTILSFILLMCIGISTAQNDIQRVRVNFENPEGQSRQLLLGFVPDNSATDGLDYGYDALNVDSLSDDLNWIIENGRYVIQGVGAFSDDKYYPLGMFLSNSGDVKISLDELENFEETIDVYLYDLELDEFTLLNDVDYLNNLSAETYLDRFFITFSNLVGATINEEVLSVSQTDSQDFKLWYSPGQDEIHINGIAQTNNAINLNVYSVDGKRILNETIQNTTSNSIQLAASNISSGIYILTLESDIYAYTTKICIEK
ncbi:T9SS type A sorting domain-containing protein [Winogradskyella eckloniae]|uniref:T9SS type A sorting domain-containing protein n=1 Tax=Winogradskyella eckloniae TaxID=1089306 RepID=UPI0015648B71|nr:T9SS type A sorting domain-containing protein [Winogradskyella eckloniae]NRD19906.1 T9SS type A sorting domain-containing protein [Winogradskyella eckloniae]